MRLHSRMLGVAAVTLVSQAAIAQTHGVDDLLMLETTVPAEADLWSQDHYADTLRPPFEIEFATVYQSPSENADALGHLWTVAEWEPYLHLSWVFRATEGASKVWKEDVGDWGYGINQFVLDTVGHWVQLPPGPYGETGWVRLVSFQEPNGFSGSVSSITGQLVEVDSISAREIESSKPGTVSGVVLIESIAEGSVVFRPEVPSDMACGMDVDPDPVVLRYRAPVAAFVTDGKQPKFEIAYPKGC